MKMRDMAPRLRDMARKRLIEAKMDEPRVVINGYVLNNAQAMAVRVAVERFMLDVLHDAALGEDDMGRSITAGYRDRLREVIKLMPTKNGGK